MCAGRVLWSREEALANVAAVEFVDLPVSDLDAAIESEFDQKEGELKRQMPMLPAVAHQYSRHFH